MANIFSKITRKTIADYENHLAVGLRLSPATVKRRTSSIRKFSQWAFNRGYLAQDPFGRKIYPTKIAALFAPPRAALRLYQRYHSISITKYLHYAILGVFCAAIGFGIYDQLFRRAPEPLAYPTALTRPNRYLSFQGRLTDTSNNPITTATNFVFKLYDASSGGNTLWNSGTCSITPDQDGIFSTLLGSSCGSEIAATVFSENASVWLGVTVGADAEATPRIQVATVGYALNAETLQGYPPGTGTSTIPYLDSTGTLLIAAASPTLQSNSGTFNIKGQTLTISAADASNGSININPDGSGTVQMSFEASTGNFLNLQGGANIGASGGKEANNLIYGYGGTDSTNFNLLKLEAGASAVPKFTVDASGNASAAGTLKTLSTAADALDVAGGIYAGASDTFKVNTSGNITGGAWQSTAIATQYGGTGADWSAVVQGSVPYFPGTGTMATLGPSTAGYVLTTQGSGTNPSWSDINSGGNAGAWTLSGNNLYPDSTSYNVAIGATDAGTADLYVAGNVGIGTTSPAQKLHVEGQCVTGDTLLPIIEPTAQGPELGSEAAGSNDPGSLYLWKEVRIDQIQPGDEILTLDEETGKFVPQMVEKLMEMGIQEIFELVTESGKRIKTTGNHPYLVKEDSFFVDQIKEHDGNQQKTIQNRGTVQNGIDINIHLTSSASFIASSKETIPQKKLAVNSLSPSAEDLTAPNPGAIKITANQAADRLVSSSESTASRGLVSNPLIEKTLTPDNSLVKQNNARWIKVAALKPGLEIATLDGWEKIISIKRVGREQVYDIQVAHTHNFVGNGIVAHNTYIKGADQLNSSFALRTADSSGADKFVITNAGNVGIGTISPLQKLHVEGQCVTGDSLLPIVNSKKQIANIQSKYQKEEIEYTRIDQIKGGEYVLSLNEETGKIEPRQIKGLLDMGVQPVYKLTTEDGRQIRTTGNHPYLSRSLSQNDYPQENIASNISPVNTQGTWTKVIYLNVGNEIAVWEEETIAWEKIKSIEELSSEQVYDIEVEGTHNFVAGHYLNSKTGKTLSAEDEEIIGRLLSGGLSSDFLVDKNQQEGNGHQSKTNTATVDRFVETFPGDGRHPLLARIIANNKYSIAKEIRNVKTSNVKLGTSRLKTRPADISTQNPEYAKTDLEEKIKSLINQILKEKGASVKFEDLKDIEFGGLVAHNTYISGNVGIGTTGPGSALDVKGTLRLSGDTSGYVGLTPAAAAGSTTYTLPSADGSSGQVLSTNGTGVLSWITGGGGGSSISAGDSNVTVTDTGDGYITFTEDNSEKMRITAGNLGIGTTSPVQKLHVEGQCVTGDTLLPVATAISNYSNCPNCSNQTPSTNDPEKFASQINGTSQIGNLGIGNSLGQLEIRSIRLIPIKDIKAGQYVLSLNEETGKIEPAKIKGLLDMGVKPVYRLTTEDGRQIRTTGNHPYLTKEGWKKVIYLKEGMEIAVASALFGGPQNQTGEQQNSNHKKRISDVDIGKKILSVNKTLAHNDLAEVKLIQTSANTFNKVLEENNFSFINSSLSKNQSAVKFIMIKSIEFMGYEQVFDIEVEGTHNFVGNGIVAHNTYIKGADQLNSSFALRTADSSGADKFVITNAGNVGIGTTSPAQKLHVEGQCVTGDSKLITEDGKILTVDQAKGGEKIYSLDQQTGKLVSAKILALLDMGVKQVFKLTTEDEKFIETTGNHPYLTRSLSENEDGQKDSNQNQGSGNYNISVNIPEIDAIHKIILSNLKDNHQNSIPKDKSSVKSKISLNPAIGQKLGAITTRANQPAERLISNPDDALMAAFLSFSAENNRINTNLSKENSFVKQNEGVWTKVIYLQPGMEIAVADTSGRAKWAKIASIKHVGEKQVYDLFIEETHNFVANGIVAHNTYISGNLGIGTTSPSQKLDIAGNATISGTLALGPQVQAYAGTCNASSEGKMYYDNASNEYYYCDGSSWKAVASGSTGVSGSGTQNYLPKWSNSSTLTDSIIYETGSQIGIGTTAPSSTLSVAGTFNTTGNTSLGDAPADSLTINAATLSLANASTLDLAASTMALNIESGLLNLDTTNSRVGLGTTSPAQKLHVEGQCVTGDSLLPIVNSKKQIANIQSKYQKEEIEYTRIDQIKGGEHVLSLNQQTGKFQWQKVEKTLDMGIKEVYELMTEKGKRIETTGNHPYLAKRLLAPGRFLKEGDPEQQKDDQKQTSNNQNVGINSPKISHISNNSSILTVNSKNIIAANKSYVNIQNAPDLVKPAKLGTITIAANQPAERLTNNPDKALSQGLDNLINTNLATGNSFVNPFKFDDKFGRVNGQWTKVIYLKVGDEIVTLDGFEKIISIKITGRKHVYDLQIENTHNFVANGIVAHNTYISTLNTGSTNTVVTHSSGTLQSRTIDSRVWGSSLVDGSGAAGQAAFWTGTSTLSGDDAFWWDNTNKRLGISTTAPSTTLDVNGTITTQTGAINSNVADSSTAVGFLLATNNTLSTQGSKLLSVKNASNEKFYIDSSGNVYAAGTILSGNGTGILMTNKSGGTVAQKALVIVDTSNNSAFTTTTTAYSKSVYGVITGVGLGASNDANGNGSCDANDNCMVAVGGEVNVTIKNTTTVAKGDYVYTSDTAGSAVTSSKMFDGVIGVVTNTSTSGSGYVKMVFKPQIQVTAAASIDKGSKHNEYRLMANDYTAVGEGANNYANTNPRSLYFDNMSDGTKTDAANTTVSGPAQFSLPTSSSNFSLPTSPFRTGLMGGQTYSTSTTDNAGNTYLGSNTVNKVFYYDRTRDSSPATLVNLGIDPNWYNGVTLAVATSSATFSQNDTNYSQTVNPNLSTTYNGSLLKVSGSYTTQAATRTIYVIIKSPTTFDWTDYNGNSSTGVTMTPGTAQSLSGTAASISLTFTAGVKYNTGDVFKIASWVVEPSGSTRGAKAQFPERSYVVAQASGVDIIDADTQKLWMRFLGAASGANITGTTATVISSVYISNGFMFWGSTGSWSGFGNTSFANDAAWVTNASNTSTFNGAISQRNSGNNYTVTSPLAIVNGVVNDVSAAVICTGNASQPSPDTLSGRCLTPQQFVGVATNGGITLINETNSTAVNASDTSAFTNIALVWNSGSATYNSSMYAAKGSSTINVYTNLASLGASFGTTATYSTSSNPAPAATAQTIYSLQATSGTSTIDDKSNTIYVGTGSNAAVIQENQNSFTSGSVRYYTKDYISEEMVGDIRGMWPLVNNFGSGLSDASVKENTLTNNGSVTFTSSGVRGQAASFNGSTQYLSCTDASCGETSKLDGGSNWSFGAWIKTSTGGNQPIISKYNDYSANDRGYLLLQDGVANKARLVLSSTGADQPIDITGTTAINDGLWHFIVGTFNGTVGNLYVDGILQVTQTASSFSIYNSTAPFGIGAHDIGTAGILYFNGTIDEPFVTATALSASQIKHMYEVGYRALQSHSSTTLGGGAADSNQQLGGSTNTVGDARVDFNNQYLYVGTNDTTNGRVSQIDLISDTNIKTFDKTANTPTGGSLLVNDDTKSIAVGYTLEVIGSATSGVKAMGPDSYATATSGNFISKTYTTAESFSQAYLWAQYVTDSSDTSNTVQVWASNDGGSNYYQCSLTNTDTSITPTEYEYFCQLNANGNSLKVKFTFARGSTKTNTYLTRWGIAWIGSDAVGGAPGGNGLYTNSSSSVANGSYLEVVHNQSTSDVLTEGWIYDGAKWVEIDDAAKTDHNTQDPKFLSWYKMEEASGDLDNAQGTAARDLIDLNSPTYQAAGRVNKAITFDGTNDYFCTGSGTTCADADTLDFAAADNFTIGGWFKHDTIATNPDYMVTKFGAGDNNTNAGYKLYMENDGDLTFAITDGGTSTTFSYTGAEQTWVVPSGVTRIIVDVLGAQGGTSSSGAAGGKGGRVQGTISVTAGQTLYIYVGGQGGTVTVGYNGGGAGGNSTYGDGNNDGGGGGGASDIRQGGNALANRVVVAGGGGGAGQSNPNSGGVGGGLTGGDGGAGYYSDLGNGGGGGTQSAGGTGDTGGFQAGGSGSLGNGGAGGCSSCVYAGGGGGGGYYGGGGGTDSRDSSTSGGGGGGGSSLVPSGGSTTSNYQTGNGQVIITYWAAEDAATSTVATYDDNAWHHLAAVKNGTSNIKLYIDGEEVASDTSLSATGTLANTGPFYLGIDSDATSDPWQGTLDEMFVYSRTLTPGEIQELYRSSKRFYIEQANANTVRLYNYSGSTQNLRLDVITGGLGRNAGTVSLAPAAADVDAQSNVNSIWINKTGSGGNLLKLQASGTDVLSLAIGGTMTLTGSFLPGTDDTYDLGSNTARWRDLYLGPTTIHLGTSTSDEYAISYDTTNNRLEFNANGSGNAEMVLDSSGNVGIGTTSPAQKLHVEGQCVTGDSLLPIVNSKKQIANIQSKYQKEEIEYTRIDQIKGGEYVLSLNEKTGKIEPGKIKGLLDMGVKPVYRLTTEDGRQIRTTGNHPYLARDVGSLLRSNIKKDPKNRQNSTRDIEKHQALIDGIHLSLTPFENLKPRVIKTMANVKPEIIVKNDFNSNLGASGSKSLRIKEPNVNFDKSNQYLVNSLNWNWENLTKNKITQDNFDVKEGRWTKVIYLQQGTEIAVAGENGEAKWAKIASIEYVGKEQVYDIEVEGTHNFVANEIVAHNTYISGNVGIGTVSPDSKLHLVGGDLYVAPDSGYTFNNASANEDLYVYGNLEVDGTIYGTTSGNVDGTGTANYIPKWSDSNTLTNSVIYESSGNIGIGTTGPSSKLDVVQAGGVGTMFNVKSDTGASAFNVGSWGNIYSGRDLTIDGTSGWTNVADVRLKVRGASGQTGDLTQWQNSAEAVLASVNASGVFSLPSNGLTVGTNQLVVNSGNVGIGTTSPQAKLHITGECVIAETLLPIKRRKKKKKGEDNGEEWEDLLVPIKDVQKGDLVASLDETSGEIVYRLIKKLMNKGFQKVVKITTVDGRSIETTTNHPYLTQVKSEWLKVSQLKPGMRIAVPQTRQLKRTFAFVDASNMIYRDTDKNPWKIDLKKLIKYLKERFGAEQIFYYAGVDNRNAIQQKLYRKMEQWGYKLRLNPVKRFVNLRGERYTKADVDARMAFEIMKYKDEYDQAIFITGDGDFFWLFEYLLQEADKKIRLIASPQKTAKELRQLFAEKFSSLDDMRKWLELDETNKKEVEPTNVSTSDLTRPSYQKAANLSRGRIEFVEISSIEETGRKEVFDIEVEGTHNFVGNDIVAHNTYIKGADQLNSSFALRTADSSGADKFVITNAGNVGIGTTAPDSKLSVRGTATQLKLEYDGSVYSSFNTDSSGNLNIDATGTKVDLADDLEISGNDLFDSTSTVRVSLGSTVTVSGGLSVTGNTTLGDAAGDSLTINASTLSLTNASTLDLAASTTALNIESGLLNLDTTNSRVGIGTISPAQKLHVEGQCVTGDSLLSVVPANSNAGQGVQGVLSSKFEEKIQIKDVKPGTEVYSLNEKTGKIEPHTINKLLDMGIKPVFKLKTDDGREIRTTGNHPYFVKETYEQENNNVQLRTVESLARDNGVREEHLSTAYEFSQVRDVWASGSTQEGSSLDSSQYSGGQWTLSQDRVYPVSLPSQGQPLRDGSLSEVSSRTQVSNGSTDQSPAPTGIPNSRNDIRASRLSQEGNWKKVIDLQPGDEIAVVNFLELRTSNFEPYVLWAKISSIEFAGYEQVYDIEVEDTHNFIANGILAHNTYISGNVGIGTTGPQDKLQIAGGIVSTSIGNYPSGVPWIRMGWDSTRGLIQSYSSSDGLYRPIHIEGTTVAINAQSGGGNVGIGTVSPGSKLAVSGNAVIGSGYATSAGPSDGLAIQGNVGIGTTGPGVKLDVSGAAGIGGYGTDVDSSILNSTGLVFPSNTSGFSVPAAGVSTVKTTHYGANLILSTRADGGGPLHERVRIDSNGNVGIGTTDPSYQLQLSLDSAAKPTSNTWTIASDIRIKDIVGSYNRGLEEVLQINPILYTYKENNALGINDPGTHIGIIAQDVQKVIPEAITTDANGYLHFTADPLNWAMVNAIKEQQLQIASLSAQLADLTLTSTGDLKITSTTATLDPGSSFGSNDPGSYELTDAAGQMIERVGAFSQAAIANLRAGLIKTQSLITNSLITNYLTANEKIVSPLIESEEVKTKELATEVISPLPDSSDLIVKLGKTPPHSATSPDPGSSFGSNDPGSRSGFGRLLVQNEQGETVAAIDAEGNASFSGQLTSEKLQVTNEATVSGTLFAKELVTDQGSFGDLLSRVEKLETSGSPVSTSEVSTPAEGGGPSPASAGLLTSEVTDSNDPGSSELSSAVLSEEEINAMVAEILATPTEASSQAEMNQPVAVFPYTDPGSSTAMEILMIGNNLSLASDSLNTTSGPLYLQSFGLGGIDILAGKIVIDSQGNMTIENNLTVKGSLFASILRPNEGGDLKIDLANANDPGSLLPKLDPGSISSGFGRLLIAGVGGQEVASIDASGSARFAGDLTASGSGTFSKIVIANAKSDPGSKTENDPGSLLTNATAGEAVLPAGSQEITINNQQLTTNSLIYITPLSSTQNKVLFVKAKQVSEPGSSWFKVAIDSPINEDIRFNWWIIN